MFRSLFSLCCTRGQLFLELFSSSDVVELELSFQNPEFKILDANIHKS